MFKTFLLQFLLLTHIICNSTIDLEERYASPMVLSTKQVVVPGYPHAFNPAIVRWQGFTIMSFRVIPDRTSSFTSHIGLVCLTEEFEIATVPQLLNLRESAPSSSPASLVPSRTEDARLIPVGDRLFIVYSDNPHPKITRGGFRMYIGELKWDGMLFDVENIQALLEFEGASQELREKNWTPFDYQGNLLLAYSLAPHTILQPQKEHFACNTICSTPTSNSWNWGTLRGGTQASLEGDKYLAFFHSSIDMESAHSEGRQMWHYFMGAYLFSASPPFKIQKMSSEPIIGRQFYSGRSYKPYWKPVKVVFPCGFISDETEIHVAYGRDDHECWIATLDKELLLQSLSHPEYKHPECEHPEDVHTFTSLPTQVPQQLSSTRQSPLP